MHELGLPVTLLRLGGDHQSSGIYYLRPLSGQRQLYELTAETPEGSFLTVWNLVKYQGNVVLANGTAPHWFMDGYYIAVNAADGTFFPDEWLTEPLPDAVLQRNPTC